MNLSGLNIFINIKLNIFFYNILAYIFISGNTYYGLLANINLIHFYSLFYICDTKFENNWFYYNYYICFNWSYVNIPFNIVFDSFVFINFVGFINKLNNSFAYFDNFICTNFNENIIKSFDNNEFDTLVNIF